MDRNKAIEIVKSHYLANKQMLNEALEFLIPELKESEEERIKRILHSISSKMSSHLSDIFTEEEFQCFDAWSNAWLEKQGQGERRMSWSEEDAYLFNETTQHLEDLIRIEKEHCDVNVQYYKRDIDWLKSLKDRIQSKQSNRLQVENAQSKDVWHDADEMPVASNRQILVLFKDSDAMVVLAEDFESLDNQLKWAYINDLIK